MSLPPGSPGLKRRLQSVAGIGGGVPEVPFAQLERTDDDVLPPMSSLSLGVSANSGPASRRVVTVTMTSGRVL